jgi:acyl-CoA reductase-like NAD-dependent aldehyde dehydrogenase
MQHPASDWRSKAKALPLQVEPVIDGARVAARSAASFEVLNPWTGQHVATLPDCDSVDVDAAVASARAAFDSGEWPGLAGAERGRALHRFAARVAADATTLGLLDTQQMGMPATQSVAGIEAAAEGLHVVADLADQFHDAVLPSAATALVMQARRPLGVVAAITPWNFPVHVALAKIGPALAAGNAVVLKPSELAPLACMRLADLAIEAGIPRGLLNVLPGRGASTGRLLALHRDVDALAFVGSTAVGLQLLQYAGQSNMKKLLLECGGKSPQIVFDDLGDLDALADQLVQGFTFNCGQVCTSGSRILVAESVYDRLLARLVERVAALQSGDPLDASTTLGPLVSATQHARVRALLGRAQDGDRLVAEGRVSGESTSEQAARLYEVANPLTPLAQEEIFGPVGAIMRFRDESEAVQLANGTRYGLSAGIWCQDLARTLRVGRALRAGFVLGYALPQPRDAGIRFMSGEPVGMSGLGADGGWDGLAAYTRLQGMVCHLG